MLFDSFIKGANKSIWIYNNFAHLIKRIVIGLLLLFIMISAIWFYLRTTPYEHYLLLFDAKVFLQSQLHAMVSHTPNDSTILWMTPQGKMINVTIEKFIRSPYYMQSVLIAKEEMYKGLIVATLINLFLLMSIIWFFSKKGHKAVSKKLIRGTKLVPVKELNQMLNQKKMKSPIRIGNSYLVNGTEIENILLVGAMRQGKSTAINWFIHCIPGKKVIWDLKGDFISLFYRPDKDHILNPFDERCVHWGFWADGENEIELNAMAESLIPSENLKGEPFFWASTAQNVFVAVANTLIERGEKSTKALLNYLFAVDLEAISSLIKGTEAAILTAKQVEKMALSIKATLTAHVKSFKYLNDDATEYFSIKKWMQDESNTDSRLFISANGVQIKTLKPLISLWIDTAIQSLMTLPKDPHRRVGFYFDEIARLQFLPSLEPGMTVSPQYGGYFVLGAQSIAQFVKCYGETITDIIFDACGTKVYFRLSSVKTSKWAAADIGEEEWEEKHETISISGNQKTGGGSLSSNEQIHVRYPVSYTEIKNLNKLSAYLNLPGEWPVAKIKLTIFDKEEIAPTFIEADIKPIKIEPIQVDVEMADNIGEKLSKLEYEESERNAE